MRRLAAAILAAPVVASIYIATLLTVPGARRALAAVMAVLLVVVAGVTVVLPPAASSIPPSTARLVSSQEFLPVEALTADAATGNAAATQSPATVSAYGTGPPTAAPTAGPGTLQDVTGAPIPDAAMSPAFLRSPTTARVAGSQPAGKRVRLTTSIELRFDRAVTAKDVRAAFMIKPLVRGTIRVLSDKVYSFTPTRPLAPNTAYTVTFTKPIRDADGVAIHAPKPLRILTVPAPGLVRFRPARGTSDVDSGAAISVRFTRPIDRKSVV